MPKKTCIPWNPVAIKNVLPKIPSLIENWVSQYSKYCNDKNKIPKKIVTNKLITNFLKKLFIRAWCAQVTLIPLDNKITVFNNGTEYAESGTNPFGGQFSPTSIAGTKEASKKSSKEAKKK